MNIEMCWQSRLATIKTNSFGFFPFIVLYIFAAVPMDWKMWPNGRNQMEGGWWMTEDCERIKKWEWKKGGRWGEWNGGD